MSAIVGFTIGWLLATGPDAIRRWRWPRCHAIGPRCFACMRRRWHRGDHATGPRTATAIPFTWPRSSR